MTFIPEGYEPLSEWLDREARELFSEKYPREITDDDVSAYFDAHPLDLPARPTLANETIRRFETETLTRSRQEEMSPLLQVARAAMQTEMDEELRRLSDPEYLKECYRTSVRSDLECKRAEAIAQLRMRAFERHRQRFWHGGFELVVIAAAGAKQPIPAHHWGSEKASKTISSGQFDGRPILIKSTNHAKPAEKDCLAWLLDTMRASPSEKTHSKSQLRDDAKDRFNVGPNAFDRAWRDALKRAGPQIKDVWGRAGALKKNRATG